MVIFKSHSLSHFATKLKEKNSPENIFIFLPPTIWAKQYMLASI